MIITSPINEEMVEAIGMAKILMDLPLKLHNSFSLVGTFLHFYITFAKSLMGACDPVPHAGFI